MAVKGKSIIMSSDSSHVPTGYGGVMKELEKYFAHSLGMKVSEVGVQNVGNPYMLDGVEKLPNHRQVPFASDSCVDWIQEKRPDFAFYLGDPHWFHWLANFNRHLISQDAKFYQSVVYFPIDNDVLPKSFVDTLLSQDVRVTFTNYGKSICEKYGVDDVHVAHHGVDTDIFFPMPEEERQKLRAQNGLDDKFVVGQVNRNNFRKMTPLLMEAFAQFAADKPDARLFLHCDPRDNQGYDLVEYADQLKLEGKVLFNSRVKSAITGVSPQEINLYYNAMDVHASATTGEGWGLTTTEAQAAGCPVIIGKHSTGPELVKHGWLCDIVDGDDYKVYTQQGGHYFRIQKQAMVNAMNEAYADRKKTRQMGLAASKHIRGNYSWPRVLKGWDKVFDSL